MNILRLIISVVLFFLFTRVNAQQVSAIEQQQVARIIRTLSADSMQGRAAFTPGIEKAADFIASEFEQIGLQPLPGSKNYKQLFSVLRAVPTMQQAQLNGKPVLAKNVFVITDNEQLNWHEAAHITTKTISATENFREAYLQLKDSDENTLVLVHPKHESIFRTYHRHLNQGNLQLTAAEGKSKVFILTNQQEVSSFHISIKNKIQKLQLTNVAGMVEGKRQHELVIFSGHYDHIGIREAVAGDSIANGANDDASGITAMLLLAHYYKQQPKPERTLLFVAFTAEEIGGYGSKYFSKQLNPDHIIAMFNMEMIGKPSKFGANSAYLTGFDKSDLGTIMQQQLKGTAYNIYPDPYPDQNLFYRSDNATFAKLGVPAHTVSSVQMDQDTTYHTVADEVDKLNMHHLTEMIRAIALAAKSVISGEDTPSRVDTTVK